MIAAMNTSDAQTAAMFTFEAQSSFVIRSIQNLLSELCGADASKSFPGREAKKRGCWWIADVDHPF